MYVKKYLRTIASFVLQISILGMNLSRFSGAILTMLLNVLPVPVQHPDQ